MENLLVENATLLVVLFSFFYFFTMISLVKYFRQNQNEETAIAGKTSKNSQASGHLRAA